MSRHESVWPWLLMGGVVAGGGLLLTWALGNPAPQLPELVPAKVPPPVPPAPKQQDYTQLDVEAAARMLASENPRGSERLHIEQVWTQLRARHRGQSLYARITAGSGFGPQGERTPPGRLRPVASENPATNRLRILAEKILQGDYPSILPGARKFFEPAQQDRAFAIAEAARKKRAAGEPLTDREKRLLKYHMDAAHKRAEWIAEGAKLLGSFDGVEFFT